jgi:hypothetical protein
VVSLLVAQDPFYELNLDHNVDNINRVFSKFVPQGYDVYVFGVQEAVSDSVLDAFAKYTGTYRLPLNAKLVPAREQTDKNKARSRRMGRALNAAELMKDEKKGRKVTPASSAADMVRLLSCDSLCAVSRWDRGVH